MVLAGRARSGSPGPPPGGVGGGSQGARSQKVWAWGSLTRWGWLGVTESLRVRSNPGQRWKPSESHGKRQATKGDMARGARVCPRTPSTRCSGPRPKAWRPALEDKLQNVIPELRESYFLHCLIRPDEIYLVSFGIQRSSASLSPRPKPQASTSLPWTRRQGPLTSGHCSQPAVPTVWLVRRGLLLDPSSRRARAGVGGHVDVNCLPRPRRPRSVVGGRLPERAQKEWWDVNQSLAGSRSCWVRPAGPGQGPGPLCCPGAAGPAAAEGLWRVPVFAMSLRLKTCPGALSRATAGGVQIRSK